MTQEAIISELRSIEASAEVLKDRSYRLRKRLEGRGGPSGPRKGRKKQGLTDEQKARLLSKRKKTLNRQTENHA